MKALGYTSGGRGQECKSGEFGQFCLGGDRLRRGLARCRGAHFVPAVRGKSRASWFDQRRGEDANLDDYFTPKALDGLFGPIAEEERERGRRRESRPKQAFDGSGVVTVREYGTLQRTGGHEQVLRKHALEYRSQVCGRFQVATLIQRAGR